MVSAKPLTTEEIVNLVVSPVLHEFYLRERGCTRASPLSSAVVVTSFGARLCVPNPEKTCSGAPRAIRNMTISLNGRCEFLTRDHIIL